MNPQDLIFLLKAQHRELQGDLSLVLESSKVETKENFESIVLNLAKFKNDLLEHLKLEDEEFYPDYFEKKIKRGEDTAVGKEFVEQMKVIGQVVMDFLDKYTTVEAIKANLSDFRRDLLMIVSTLNVRIETEEDGLFEVYLAM